MSDRILVIEDNVAARQAYKCALDAAGFDTACFTSYYAAADEIDAGAGALLLVNGQLPPGTPQGISVARMARFRRPRLPIIFVTDQAEVAKFAEAEGFPVLTKPIEPHVLVATVGALLKASPPPPT